MKLAFFILLQRAAGPGGEPPRPSDALRETPQESGAGAEKPLNGQAHRPTGPPGDQYALTTPPPSDLCPDPPLPCSEDCKPHRQRDVDSHQTDQEHDPT